MKTLREKILSGHSYTIKGSPTTIRTGKAGVLLYIDACENENIPERLVAQSIFVNYEDGEYCIQDLIITEKPNYA